MNEAPLATPRGDSAVQEAHLRDMVASSLHTRDYDRCIQHARILLQEKPGARTLRFLRRVAEGADELRPFRVAFLSSVSIEFANDALIAYGFVNGLGMLDVNRIDGKLRLVDRLIDAFSRTFS